MWCFVFFKYELYFPNRSQHTHCPVVSTLSNMIHINVDRLYMCIVFYNESGIMLHLPFALLFVLFIFRSFPRGMWSPEFPEMLYVVKIKRHTKYSLCPLSTVFRGNPCKMNICGDPSGVKTKDRGRIACEVQFPLCLTGCWKQGVHGVKGSWGLLSP